MTFGGLPELERSRHAHQAPPPRAAPRANVSPGAPPPLSPVQPHRCPVLSCRHPSTPLRHSVPPSRACVLPVCRSHPSPPILSLHLSSAPRTAVPSLPFPSRPVSAAFLERRRCQGAPLLPATPRAFQHLRRPTFLNAPYLSACLPLRQPVRPPLPSDPSATLRFSAALLSSWRLVPLFD